MKILALIPARSGSKRIPQKNIKLLNERPLIAYTIEAAKKSKYINRIVVSTDSEIIASTAREFGAEIPFLRPDSISGSDSTEMEFFEHTLDWLSEHESYEPDLIVLLYPTSPLRKAKSIDKAIEIISNQPDADSLRSIRLCSEHPYKMWCIEDGWLTPFVKEENPNVHTLSYHLLPQIFIQNASIYITRTVTIRNKKSSTGDKIIPFVMSDPESIDINNPIDFDLAEMIIRENYDR
jgi:CMP-N,N'-diacetyllegionaminic acid synthase